MPKKKITKITPKWTLISRVVVVKWTQGDKPIAWVDYPLPENGYTPLKGVDYFDWEKPTEEELISLITPLIPDPIPWAPWKDWNSISVGEILNIVEKAVEAIPKNEVKIIEDRTAQYIEVDWKKVQLNKIISNIGAWMSTWVVDFTALRDTPNSYVGQASKVVKVKADETGLEFVAWGWGWSVDSVNWQTGVVVLDTGDIAEVADANYVSDAQLAVIGNTSGTNTGNQTITNSSDATSHTVTLSASGGSVQLIEGSNITLTTGWSGSAGTVTIAATGGGGSPGGSDTQVQFNDGGAFGGDTAFTWDKTTNALTLWVGGTGGWILWTNWIYLYDSGSGSWVEMVDGWVNFNLDNWWVWTVIDADVWGSISLITSDLTTDRIQSFPDADGTIIVGASGSFSWVGTATTAFTVTIGATQANNTYKVNITPTASLSAALFYISAKTTTTFTVTYLAGLTWTVTFDWLLTV